MLKNNSEVQKHINKKIIVKQVYTLIFNKNNKYFYIKITKKYLTYSIKKNSLKYLNCKMKKI